MTWKRGARARVVTLEALTMPKGKAPFAVGQEVLVSKVSPDGQRLVIHGHSGWFRASRFEPL